MPIFSISIIMNRRGWNDIAFIGRICDCSIVVHGVADNSNLVTNALFCLIGCVMNLEGQKGLGINVLILLGFLQIWGQKAF